MLFAIDIGNSNIVIGAMEGTEVVFTCRMSTDRSKTEDEYAVMLKNVLDLRSITPDRIEGAIISSVVPPLTPIIKLAVETLLGKTPLVVGPGLKTGLNILIEDPGQLGGDLVAAAVAALQRYKPPMIIFDMGTATTVSVLDAKGRYLGGMIFPGVMVSQDALVSRTSLLPRVSPDVPPKVIGRSTIDCIQSGTIYGNAAAMDGMVDRIEAELGQEATVIATGGLAKYILPFCRRNILYDDDLLLQGLRIIYDKNTH